MKAIKIRVVKNGFIVTEDNSQFGDARMMVTSPEFVFESFSHLSDWLNANLDKPEGAKVSP